jgi:23S rRNA (uridine2552-2'-O)-methyltransferase
LKKTFSYRIIALPFLRIGADIWYGVVRGRRFEMRKYEEPDFWSRKAFSEGYPARSVYKLKEMNEKFALFKKGCAVLDLGAAPGSWTLFALRLFGGFGRVVAVDMLPLERRVAADNLTTVTGDLFAPDTRSRVREGAPYDAVLCDAAPATTGNRVVDAARSGGLAELAFDYAEEMLKGGGNFVVKIFQGGDEGALLKKMRNLFAQAKGFKPEACRSNSVETYLVGIGKKETAK